ncbi:MAG: hypothetical protein BWX84_00574 [Verrucomicrobia bacterium ADurb.Bin118]|jgi:hypothetical protein|nr:MAG: hypothetical protein BWX84_00574 [Verrucomicrobia bacterium ADurb.Bin118]
MGPKGMQTTMNPQLGLLDCFMPSVPTNAFLQTLDTALDWRPIERVLQAMYLATAGRPPGAGQGQSLRRQ